MFGLRAGACCWWSTSASLDAGRLREERRAVPVELGVVASAELLSFFTPSWVKGFCVVDALEDAVGAAGVAGVDVAAGLVSEGGGWGVDDDGADDEEGFEASSSVWSGFGADGAGFPSFARRLARIYCKASVT